MPGRLAALGRPGPRGPSGRTIEDHCEDRVTPPARCPPATDGPVAARPAGRRIPEHLPRLDCTLDMPGSEPEVGGTGGRGVAGRLAPDLLANVLRLEPLPDPASPGVYSLAEDLDQIRVHTAELMRLLQRGGESSPYPMATEAGARAGFVAAAAVVVFIERLRAVVSDEQRDVLTERVPAMQKAIAAGLGSVVELLGGHGHDICFDATKLRGGLPLPLPLALLLQYIFGSVWLLWPHADPNPRIPDALNTVSLITRFKSGRQAWIVDERTPQLVAIVRDGCSDTLKRQLSEAGVEQHDAPAYEHAVAMLRTAAAAHLVYTCWFLDVASLTKLMRECDMVGAALKMIADLRPPPPVGERDNIAEGGRLDRHDVLVHGSNAMFGLTSTLLNHAHEEADVNAPRDWMQGCIAAGVLGLCLRVLRSFVALPEGPGSAHPFVSMLIGMLQMMATPPGCAQAVLDNLAAHESSVLELHSLLVSCVDAEEAPIFVNGMRVNVKAMNALALLFGREEEGVTVPTKVMRVLVMTLDDILRGVSSASATSQIEALVAVSLSDANTQVSLVYIQHADATTSPPCRSFAVLSCVTPVCSVGFSAAANGRCRCPGRYIAGVSARADRP